MWLMIKKKNVNFFLWVILPRSEMGVRKSPRLVCYCVYYCASLVTQLYELCLLWQINANILYSTLYGHIKILEYLTFEWQIIYRNNIIFLSCDRIFRIIYINRLASSFGWNAVSNSRNSINKTFQLIFFIFIILICIYILYSY